MVHCVVMKCFICLVMSSLLFRRYIKNKLNRRMDPWQNTNRPSMSGDRNPSVRTPQNCQRSDGVTRYPSKGCLGQWHLQSKDEGAGARSRYNLRTHFFHCHIWDTIVILEEGNRPHPWFPNCDIFVPLSSPKRRHPTTPVCEMSEE